jgi:hypothetical protein
MNEQIIHPQPLIRPPTNWTLDLDAKAFYNRFGIEGAGSRSRVLVAD